MTTIVTGAGHTTWSPSKVPLFSFLSIEPPLSTQQFFHSHAQPRLVRQKRCHPPIQSYLSHHPPRPETTIPKCELQNATRLRQSPSPFTRATITITPSTTQTTINPIPIPSPHPTTAHRSTSLRRRRQRPPPSRPSPNCADPPYRLRLQLAR